MTKGKKRYAVVGTGGRSGMYLRALTGAYTDHCRLVAICDKNPGRMEVNRQLFSLDDHGHVPGYLDRQFDRMVAETQPDVVIVTTKDRFHDKYIVRAMELGCDVITEKPMTIDEKKCQRIVNTVRKTGRKVRVTFNYRYAPSRTQIKDLLMSGVIGRIISVDFHWLLDTRHGADYFRRWHRYKSNSGGLMVHKATHHFDLVNWWISSRPAEVFAFGNRSFYTPETAGRYGLRRRAERCLVCPEKTRCKFYLDIKGNERLRAMYLDNEKYDGYFRDRCVFAREITIEDTMNLAVRYKSGAFMSFSLNAFCPKEGYEIRFNGTRGRLEFTTLETSYVSGSGDAAKQHATIKRSTALWIYPHFKDPYKVGVWHGTGGHGGGDPVLLDGLLLPKPPKDKYRRAASFAEGAWSILLGVAANKSMKTGKPVRVDRLVRGLPEPKFTKMPGW